MNNRKQIMVIHGGETFDTYEGYLNLLKSWEVDDINEEKKGWKDTFQTSLGDSYQVIRPRMPNQLNAKYAEWKIWFEKYIPQLNPEIVLVGHSLGAMFLVKYLSENIFPKTILGTFLVAACHDDKDSNYSLVDFNFLKPLDGFEKQGGRIFLYHSEDDPLVPMRELEKYKKELKTATIRILKDRGHFNIEMFPEIIEDIKRLC